MSSGTTYDWAYEREQERRRQVALRAELEELRLREQALRRLRAAAAGQGIHAELPRMAQVDQDASSAELSEAVVRTRAGLDALQTKLDTALAQRTRQRLAEVADVGVTAPEPTADAAGERWAEIRRQETADRRREDEDRVAAAAAAARDLVETESVRCVESEVDGLVRLAARVGRLDATAARVALADLDVRVTESINRRRRADEADQLRARLMYLATEVSTEQRPALRRRVASAPDDALAGLREEVERAVEAERRRRSRAEVSERVLGALRQRGYEVGEHFADVLAGGGQAALLTSRVAPEYGLRLTVDEREDRINATVVKRDDAVTTDPAGLRRDLAVQEAACRDLAAAEEGLAADGLRLRVLRRRRPDGRVPTMAADHWAASASTSEVAAASAADLPRQRDDGGQDRTAAERRRRQAEHERAQRQSRTRSTGGPA